MKKLNLHEVKERLLSANIKIFTPQDLEVMFAAKKRAVQAFLNYNVNKKAFVRIKRGLYGLKKNLPQEFVLANNVYSPSYVSLDSALSYYNLIPETVYAVTSVTSKATREFTVNHRLFKYRKIKKEAYAGYLSHPFNGETAYVASREKAVVDSLYFVYLGKKNLNERLKLDKVDSEKLNKYLSLFGKRKFTMFVKDLLEKI